VITRKLGTNIIAGITAIACIGTGIKSCNNHTERIIKGIQYELKHNPQDSLFWTYNYGAKYYINEQKRIQKQINYYEKLEPFFSKVHYWKKAKYHIRKDQNIRQLIQLKETTFNRKLNEGYRPVYREIKKNDGKNIYTTREVNWVTKKEAEELKSKGHWDGYNVVIRKK